MNLLERRVEKLEQKEGKGNQRIAVIYEGDPVPQDVDLVLRVVFVDPMHKEDEENEVS